MSKRIKDLVARELQSRYAQLDSALWVELLGCDGITTNEFRRDLRARKMRLEVVKNSMFRRAIGDGPLRPLATALQGPAALVTGGESLVDAAKVIEEWMRKIKGLKLRGAVLEGEYLDEQRVAGLSRMPTRREMQAGIARALRSPGLRLAGAILSGGGRIAGCLKALIEKLERPETAAPAA